MITITISEGLMWPLIIFGSAVALWCLLEAVNIGLRIVIWFLNRKIKKEARRLQGGRL